MRPLIIERPELQTRAQRLGWASVTLACWFLWLYLFVPLLSLVAWVLGATLVYQVMLQNLELRELLRLLGYYGGGILVLNAVYLLWAVVSYLRFRGLDRRQAPPPATLEQLAASHRLSTLALHRLRAARRVVISVEDLERMFAATDADEQGVEPRMAAAARAGDAPVQS